MHEPMQSVEEKSGHKEIDIVPKSGCGNSDEVSPSIAAQRKRNGGDIHPCLKEVQPTDVRFKISRERQDENKYSRTDGGEEFGAT